MFKECSQWFFRKSQMQYIKIKLILLPLQRINTWAYRNCLRNWRFNLARISHICLTYYRIFLRYKLRKKLSAKVEEKSRKKITSTTIERLFVRNIESFSCHRRLHVCFEDLDLITFDWLKMGLPFTFSVLYPYTITKRTVDMRLNNQMIDLFLKPKMVKNVHNIYP